MTDVIPEALTAAHSGGVSLADYLSLNPAAERDVLGGLSSEARDDLEWSWYFWGRPSQLPPPGGWSLWLVMAGRGFGKTRTGAEWIRMEVESGRRRWLGLIAPTTSDIRKVMVEGESGILATARPEFRPVYEPTKTKLTWPNGAIAMTFSAEEPDRLRGPQFDGFWADEVGIWAHTEAWDNLMLGLRLGQDPRGVITTTPKPVRIIRDLLQDPTCVRTGGSTYDNRANLPSRFLREIIGRYEGTRIGKQELYAELLTESPGALVNAAQIEAARVMAPPDLERVVVGIDPAASATKQSDETGIVVVGRSEDDHYYVLADASCRVSPDTWGRRAVAAYQAYRADRVVAEANNGGDMVEHVIRTVDPAVSYRKVFASRGKLIRAEPIGALYEQGRVHHAGTFGDLEGQLCLWEPGSGDPSPDRLDALVWAMTELMGVRAQWLGGETASADPGSDGARPSWVW